MDGKTSLKYLQEYISKNEPGHSTPEIYMIKLMEEVGELSAAIIRGKKAPNDTDIKGTLDEEIFDVLYYTMMLATVHGIDMERLVKVKSDMNALRYPSGVKFEEGR